MRTSETVDRLTPPEGPTPGEPARPGAAAAPPGPAVSLEGIW